jgi:DNA-binding transcriptional MocR family regulator
MLQDPGGPPAERLTGRPLNVSHFLRIAIPLAGAPLGMTMSLPRRLALLAWARRSDAWIIEDDYPDLATIKMTEIDQARQALLHRRQIVQAAKTERI